MMTIYNPCGFLTICLISILIILPLPLSSLQDDLFYFTSFADPEEWAEVYPTCRDNFDFQYMREEADKRYVHYMNRTGFINISSPIPQTREPLSLRPDFISRTLSPIRINHNDTLCIDYKNVSKDCKNRDFRVNDTVLLIVNRPPAKPGSHFVSYGFQKLKKCLVANEFTPCHISPRLGRIRGLVLSANRSAEDVDKNRFKVEDTTKFASITVGKGIEYVFSEAIFMGTGEDGLNCSSRRGSHVIDGTCYPMEIYMYFVNPSLPAMTATIILVVPVEEVPEGHDNIEIRAVVSAARGLYEDEKLFLKTHRREEILEKNYHSLGNSEAIRHLTKDEGDIDYLSIPPSIEIEKIETLLLDHWERIQAYKTATFLLYEDYRRVEDIISDRLQFCWKFANRLESGFPPNLFINHEPNPSDPSQYLSCTDASTTPPKDKLCQAVIYIHLYLAQQTYHIADEFFKQRDNLSETRTPFGIRIPRQPDYSDHSYSGLLRLFNIKEYDFNKSSEDLVGVKLPPEMDFSNPIRFLPSPSPNVQLQLEQIVLVYGMRRNDFPNAINETTEDILKAYNISFVTDTVFSNVLQLFRQHTLQYYNKPELNYIFFSSVAGGYFSNYIYQIVYCNYSIYKLKLYLLGPKFDVLYDYLLALGIPLRIVHNNMVYFNIKSIYDARSPGEFMDNDIKKFLDTNVNDHPLKYQKLKKTEPVQANIRTPTGDTLVSLGNMGMTQEEYEEHENLDHPTRIVGYKFQISWLIPEGGGYYRYQGSSPVPPCYMVEDVIVFRRPIRMTKFQISALTRVPTSGGEVRDIKNTFGVRHNLRTRNVNPFAGEVFYDPRNHQFLDDDTVHKNSILEKRRRENKAGRLLLDGIKVAVLMFLAKLLRND